MKHFMLIWAGLWRKPARTVFTMLSVAVAFFLFSVLQGMKTGVDRAIADARADLLLVGSRVSAADRLPLAYFEQIKSVPGVKEVSIMDGFGATYQRPTQPLWVVASNPDKSWPVVYPNFIMSPAALDALIKTRTGAIVVEELARKYGWKTGDRIPLNSTTAQLNGSTTWVFDVVGTFKYDGIDSSNNYIMVNFAYVDEARQANRDTVGRFNVVVSDPRQAVAVTDEIDRRFANSAHETRTESLREQAQAQMHAIGDLDFVIRSIIGAVLAALLFATSTMMMQSLRERTPELAVLKTLGFTDAAIFVLVLVEAVIICTIAALLGLSLAALALPVAARMLPALSMPMTIIPTVLLAAVAIALVSVIAPAFRAARLEIVDALSGR